MHKFIKLIENSGKSFSEVSLFELFTIFSKNREYFYSTDFNYNFCFDKIYPEIIRFLSLVSIRLGNYDFSEKYSFELSGISKYKEEGLRRLERVGLLKLSGNELIDKYIKYAECNIVDFGDLMLPPNLTRSISKRGIDFSRLFIDEDSQNLINNQKRFFIVLDKILNSKRIGVVGNGSSIKNLQKGSEIDACDMVIRINFARVSGFERFAGSRTDLMVSSNQHFNGDKNISNSLRGLNYFPSVPCLLLDSAHDMLTPLPSIIGVDKEIVSLPHHFRRIMKKIGYQFSTTGLSLIIFLGLILKKELHLFGFDFYSDPSNPYYNSPLREELFEPMILHEIQFERLLARDILPKLCENIKIY